MRHLTPGSIDEPGDGDRSTIAETRDTTSAKYAHGRRDGLRLALAILAAEEAKWFAVLGTSSSGRTNAVRVVRHKALQVAQQRIRTALNRLTTKGRASIDPELASALEQVGL